MALFFVAILSACEGFLIAETVSIQNNSRPPEIDDAHTNKKSDARAFCSASLYIIGDIT